VTVADGPGYGTLMVDPQFSKTPWDTFAYTAEWIAHGAAGAPPAPAAALAPPRRTAEVELTIGEAAIRETRSRSTSAAKCSAAC